MLSGGDRCKEASHPFPERLSAGNGWAEAVTEGGEDYLDVSPLLVGAKWRGRARARVAAVLRKLLMQSAVSCRFRPAGLA